MRETAAASDSPRALRNPVTLQAGLQSINWAI
jgi:hypothetical protein